MLIYRIYQKKQFEGFILFLNSVYICIINPDISIKSNPINWFIEMRTIKIENNLNAHQ